MDKILALDIGASSIKSCLADKYGKLSDEMKTAESKSYDDFLASIENILKNLNKKPAGICAALPGGYDIKNDLIFAPNLQILNGKHIRKDMEKRFGLPVIAENDANLAAYGEYVFAEKRGINNMAFFTLGTGFGGGLILNGKLLQSDITLFEAGHISIDLNGRLCGCGRRGCLDEYCSTSGLAAIYEKESGKAGVSPREIENLAEKGDARALKALENYGILLAEAFANMAALFAPEKIKFGGGLSELAPYYIDTCKNRFNEIVFPPYRNRVQIERAVLKNRAGMLGAAALFFKL